MAVPTIVSMLSTSMYNLADTYFVSSINTQSVAAVGISFCMMAVIQAVGFFFGHGSGNYISRRLGAEDTDSARKMAATGVVLSFISGLCITILGLSFLTPLSLLLGSTPTILPYTERYLGIILLGAPIMTMSLTLNNQMRFQGNTMYAMKGILSGVLLNLVLAPTLILYFCLGITGAAIATLISQCFGCLMLLLMTTKGQNIRIEPRLFTPSKAFLKEIIAGGTPALETRIRQYFHLDAQRGSRLIRRRSHRRHEYCHPNSLLHLCHRHRFGTGIPATLRILLWCTSLQSCKRSLHLLYQVRHDFPYRLRCSRICLCRIHHHSLQRRERSGECGNSSPALAGTQLSTRGLHRIDQYAHADH